MPKRTTKVIFRKLGKHKTPYRRENGMGIYGLVYTYSDNKGGRIADNEIFVDPRQSDRQLMNTLIHEKLHILYPNWSETKVNITANRIANVLWSMDYRRKVEC